MNTFEAALVAYMIPLVVILLCAGLMSRERQ